MTPFRTSHLDLKLDLKTDQQAVLRLKRGDIGGLEALMQRYYAQAVKTAYLITRDKSWSEDIVQAAFLRIYEHINQFDEQRSFVPYFFRSVVNEAVKEASRAREDISLDHPSIEGIDYIIGVARSYLVDGEETELHDAIWDALGQLPTSQRAAVILRYYLDLSEAESAAELDCPPTTLKWWMSEARAKLRILLAPFRPATARTNMKPQKVGNINERNS